MTSTATSDPIGDQIVDLELVEVVGAVWCAALDPSVLTGADAARGAERLAVVIRRFQAAQLALAKRAEECNAYAARAHSGADWLAGLNGSSKAEAARALDTAKRLDSCPATKAAFAAGEISRDEADAVSGAATADPTCEQRLLDGAKARHDLRETRTAADKARQAARSAEDEKARQARLHKTRGLRIGTNSEGHVEIRGRFTPAAFAGVKPIIDAHMKARVDQARRDGEREGWDAYRADAFLTALAAGARGATTTSKATTRPTVATGTPRAAATAGASAASWARPTPAAAAASSATPAADRGPFDPVPTTTASAPSAAAGPSAATAPTGAAAASTATADPAAEGRLFAPGAEIAGAEGLDPRVNWNLVILVDGIALKRGYRAPGETCEIPGIGTIPVAWIQQLLPDIHTEMLIHDSVDIRAYATRTRHRTRPVDLAVRVRDRDCTVPRCHRDVSELDHIIDFADTHDTSVVNVHGMCNANHDDKTYRDATFTRDDTNWNWWPPGTNPTTAPPMTAPIGTHLTPWNLDHLPTDDPDPDDPDPDDPPTLEFD